MRRFYFFVFLSFALCLALFFGSFLYLDTRSHGTYHYTINLDGYDVGTIRVDSFETEEKRIYRSVSDIPFDPTYTDIKTRMTLDLNYGLESYLKDSSDTGAAESVLIEGSDNVVSSIGTAESMFAFSDRMPIRDLTFVFEEASPVTYIPVIENFDFRRGKSQGFNAITIFSPLLPPMKRFVTLTSVRDEYLVIDSKKIKTEVLLLKIKNFPQGTVWVAKSDRSLVMVDLSSPKLKIIRTFSQKKSDAKKYEVLNDRYKTREASFVGNGVRLAGTITSPTGEGKHPAILLAGNCGPEDREYAGLFTSLSDELSTAKYVVLRFDPRGIGKSEGDASFVSGAQSIEDINAAIDFLKAQEDVDPDAIFLAGHSKGAYYISKIAAKRNDIRGLVFLSPITSFQIKDLSNIEKLNKIAAESRWSDEYFGLVSKTYSDAIKKLDTLRGDKVSILRKRCYLTRMREERGDDPLSAYRQVSQPVLILQGKADNAIPQDLETIVDKVLQEGGNANHTLKSFNHLDSHLGQKVNNGIEKIHYKVDKALSDEIAKWVAANSRPAVTEPGPNVQK